MCRLFDVEAHCATQTRRRHSNKFHRCTFFFLVLYAVLLVVVIVVVVVVCSVHQFPCCKLVQLNLHSLEAAAAAADAELVQSLCISISIGQRCLPMNPRVVIIFTEARERVSRDEDLHSLDRSGSAGGRHANALSPPTISSRHFGCFYYSSLQLTQTHTDRDTVNYYSNCSLSAQPHSYKLASFAGGLAMSGIRMPIFAALFLCYLPLLVQFGNCLPNACYSFCRQFNQRFRPFSLSFFWHGQLIWLIILPVYK